MFTEEFPVGGGDTSEYKSGKFTLPSSTSVTVNDLGITPTEIYVGYGNKDGSNNGYLVDGYYDNGSTYALAMYYGGGRWNGINVTLAPTTGGFTLTFASAPPAGFRLMDAFYMAK